MAFYLRFTSRGSRFLRANRLMLSAAVLLAASAAAVPARGQSGATPIRIDASQPFVAPGVALFHEGSATSPSGATLGVNSRYLTLDGKPWLPVAGEFHFSRYPRDQWEDEILKMKAAGVDIVSTYVIWIHHEEVEGQFDWSGQHDLRAFAQLCSKRGMVLLVRIGPWDHAEVRNGGLPDWVLKQGTTRVNDPVYLASVRAWYAQIGIELKGLLWKDGGPVIGIQLENEYAKRGPGAGEEHILELKKIAIASGLDVPLYLVTGWDNAVVPRGAVIPVYGGYPDAPWDGSIARLPAAEVYAFRFESRVAANVNTNRSQGAPAVPPSSAGQIPYLTAEIGGGIEDTYHRRPVIAPDDVAAMVPVMLGSGVNLYGTYMFQGGENPDGKPSTLQESQETGYPNDLPIKSYDFQAPLGEFGQERASFRKLKVFDDFLNDLGADLAPMTVHTPEELPASSTDLSVPRAAVRSNGDSGFIFFNNYVRGYAMPARKAAQFLVRLPTGTLAVPRHPVDLPSGAYFIWPFNLRLGEVTLRYSTAQFFTRIEGRGPEGSDSETIYLEALPGIPAELAFDASTLRSVKTSSGETTRDSGVIYVSGITPAIDSSVDVVSLQGKSVRFVVLTAHEAEDAYKFRIGGSDHLLITGQDFMVDPENALARILLRSRAGAHFEFAITPPLAGPLHASLPLTRTESTDRIDRFTAHAQPRQIQLETHQICAAGDAAPVKLGPALSWRPQGVAQAPAACEMPQAAKWEITIPPGATNGLSELYLQVNYQGDVARLSAGGRLLDDDFYNGKPWMVGLSRFLATQRPSEFQLSILPLRKDAPVYLELPKPLQFAPNGQIDKLSDIRLVPEYQLAITIGEE